MFYKTEQSCRSCGETNLELILSFDQTPLADCLLTADQLDKPELRAPLNLAFCPNCALVQITETVSPEILFCEDYPYFSSVSKALQQHFEESARELINARALNSDSLVIEAASNDGYMLKNFAEKGIRVLGIDPASKPAKAADQAGIPTLCTFFTKSLARILREQRGVADVFLANNVLAHVRARSKNLCKVAFVPQPLDMIFPPMQSSIGIWTYEVARRLARSGEVIVHSGSLHKKVEIDQGVDYRRLSITLDQWLKGFLNHFSGFYHVKRPIFASPLYYLEYAWQVANDLRKRQCDIVHPKGGIFLKQISRFARNDRW